MNIPLNSSVSEAYGSSLGLPGAPGNSGEYHDLRLFGHIAQASNWAFAATELYGALCQSNRTYTFQDIGVDVSTAEAATSARVKVYDAVTLALIREFGSVATTSTGARMIGMGGTNFTLAAGKAVIFAVHSNGTGTLKLYCANEQNIPPGSGMPWNTSATSRNADLWYQQTGVAFGAGPDPFAPNSRYQVMPRIIFRLA